MKIGIVVSTHNAETCWNALRYANYCLKQNDQVKVFFMGQGVEYQQAATEKFNTNEQADLFLKSGGKIFACGTCLQSREQGGSEMCPLSTLKDLDEIVKESDKVLTF